MHVTGQGVTRNFLTILETDVRRSANSLIQLAAATALVLLLAWLTLKQFEILGFLIVPGVLAFAFLLGLAHTRWFVLGSYEVSLRDHWNRWMRWSVSCRSLRECYRKVHGQGSGPTWWVGGILLALLLLIHIVLVALIIDGLTTYTESIPLFALDAALVGFLGGRRLLERVWYRRFLRSCNELLRDGTIGLWGVY